MVSAKRVFSSVRLQLSCPTELMLITHLFLELRGSLYQMRLIQQGLIHVGKDSINYFVVSK